MEDVFGSDDEAISVNEYNKLNSKHQKLGYADGIVKGQQETIQQGFDEGFEIGSAIGLRLGKLIAKAKILGLEIEELKSFEVDSDIAILDRVTQMVHQNRDTEVSAIRNILIELQLYDEKRHDTFLLLRFLKARRFDIGKTKEMLIDYENWHKESDVPGIIKSFAYPEQAKVAQLYPRFYHKTDKKGRPIYIEQLKDIDSHKLFQLTTEERFVKKYIRDYEKLIQYRFVACSAAAGQHIDQGTTILDLKSVPLSQFNQVRKVIQLLSKIAQNFYPETMGRMFIVNAPMLFTAVWAVIKGMLDENTVSKISLVGSGFQATLLKEINAENLPVFLGGSCTCPGGCQSSDLGPWNDGSVANYPIAEWELVARRDDESTNLA